MSIGGTLPPSWAITRLSTPCPGSLTRGEGWGERSPPPWRHADQPIEEARRPHRPDDRRVAVDRPGVPGRGRPGAGGDTRPGPLGAGPRDGRPARPPPHAVRP